MRLYKYGTTALVILVGLLLCGCARNEQGAMPTAPRYQTDGPVVLAKCEGEDCSLHKNCIGIKPVTVPLNGNKKFSVLVRLNCKTPAASLTIPLSYAGYPDISIDTSIVDAYGNRGITQEKFGARDLWAYRTSLVDSENRKILIGYVSFSGSLQVSKGPLVRVHFKLSPDASPGVVYVDGTHMPPENTLVLTDEAANDKKLYLHRGKITVGSPSPNISLSTTRLTFKHSMRMHDAPSRTFDISDAGVGAQNWTVADYQQEASLAPTFGTDPGAVTNSMAITDIGSTSQSGTVQTFDISNVGVGRLKWTVADNRPWISVSPASGTGSGTVAVSVKTAGLAAGSHTGRITIIDPSAVNSPQTVLVTLIITELTERITGSGMGMSAEAGGQRPPHSGLHPWDF